jgi:hypothetical protein
MRNRRRELQTDVRVRPDMQMSHVPVSRTNVNNQILTCDTTDRTAGRFVRLTASPPSDDCLEYVGASTAHNPMGLHSLLQG